MTLPLRWTGLRRALSDVWPPAAIGLGLILVLSRPFGPWTAPVAGVSAGSLVWAGRRYASPGLRELGRYVAGFVAFTALRYLADDLGPAPYFAYPLAVDRLLGFGTPPTVWLQHAGPRWIPLAAALYGSYFFLPPLTVGLVWRCWPDRLRPLVSATLALFGVSALIHLVVPTAPPWMAAGRGLLPGVEPVVLGYFRLLSPAVYAVASGISSNPVAAMPSVHIGVTTLLCCALWPTRLRLPALAYLGAMTVTVIYSGDHYLMDALAGAVLAVVCWRWAARGPRLASVNQHP